MYHAKYLKYQSKIDALMKCIKLRTIQVGGEKPDSRILKDITIRVIGDDDHHLDPIYGFVYCETGLIKSLYHYGDEHIKTYIRTLYKKDSDDIIRPNNKMFELFKSTESDVTSAKFVGQFLCVLYISMKFRTKIDEISSDEKNITLFKIKEALKNNTDKIDKINRLQIDQHRLFETEMLETEKHRLITEAEIFEKEKQKLIMKVEELQIKIQETTDQIKNAKKIVDLCKFKTIDKQKKDAFNPNKINLNDPKYWYVILGVLWWISNNKLSIKQYYEGINDMINQFKVYIPDLEIYNITIPDDFETTYFSKDQLDDPSGMTFEKALTCAYRHIAGSTQLHNQEWAVTKCIPEEEKPVTFPDCGEVVVRNLLNILSYTDGIYDVKILETYGVEPITDTHSKVLEYYTEYNTFSKQITQIARNKWGEIVSNLRGVTYNKICHDADGNILKFDIVPGHDLNEPSLGGHRQSNLLTVISHLLPKINKWEDFNSKTITCEVNLNSKNLGVINFTINEMKYVIEIISNHFSITPVNSDPFKTEQISHLSPDEKKIIMHLINNKIESIDDLYWNRNALPDEICNFFNTNDTLFTRYLYNSVFAYLHGMNNTDLRRRMILNFDLLDFENYDLTDYNIMYEVPENYRAENVRLINLNRTHCHKLKTLNDSTILLLNKLPKLTHLKLGNALISPLGRSLDNLTKLAHLILGRNFNQSLGTSLDNLTNLTHLKLGNSFNRSLRISLDNLTNLTHLTFSDQFNQSLGTSLNNLINLTHLTFGLQFNQPLHRSLDNLTNLTHLTFGWNFNQLLHRSLDNLTNLTHLTFGRNFNQPLHRSLDNLTNLTHLTFYYAFNTQLGTSLDNLENLTHLIFGWEYNMPFENSLNKLTKLEYLKLGHAFNLPLGTSLHELKKLKFLEFGGKFNRPLENSLENLIDLTHLKFGNNFNLPLDHSLSKLHNLKYLAFGNLFNKPLEKSLDNLINLTHLSFGHNFNQILNPLVVLPKLSHLRLGTDFKQTYDPLLEMTNLIYLLLWYTHKADISHYILQEHLKVHFDIEFDNNYVCNIDDPKYNYDDAIWNNNFNNNCNDFVDIFGENFEVDDDSGDDNDSGDDDYYYY